LSDYYQRYGRAPGAESPGWAEGGRQYQYRTVTEEDLSDIFGDQSPFSDFFETYFGSTFSPGMGRGARTTSRGRARAARGQDVESPVEVTLAEAYRGATRVFELADVDGSTRRLEIKIPAGVDNGSRIRIPGQGVQGPAGRGDLYLLVRMLPHPDFTREGTTLRTKIEVPLAVAVLGGEAQVPTPDGRRLMLRIPPGTPNGKTFRLRGQGMPELGHPERRGDLYAEVSVKLPTHLNEQQRRLFEAFARSIGYTGSETTAGTGGSHG
jgi:curved DNA-binding protein